MKNTASSTASSCSIVRIVCALSMKRNTRRSAAYKWWTAQKQVAPCLARTPIALNLFGSFAHREIATATARMLQQEIRSEREKLKQKLFQTIFNLRAPFYYLFIPHWQLARGLESEACPIVCEMGLTCSSTHTPSNAKTRKDAFKWEKRIQLDTYNRK